MPPSFPPYGTSAVTVSEKGEGPVTEVTGPGRCALSFPFVDYSVRPLT